MKIWVNPVGFNHAKQLIKNNNVDYVIVGIKHKMSCYNTCLLSLSQIKQINCSKIAVCLNNLYSETQIKEVVDILKFLKKIKIKTIIFLDFAIKQICDEINYQPNFVYNSETLLTNYGQLPFFKKNNINNVVLSNKLFLNEIKQIANNSNGVKLHMQVEGYDLMMHSKWKLLTNFGKQFKMKQKFSNKHFFLKEETRDLASIISEDETGSFMFSGYNLSIISFLDQLSQCIDSIYFLSYLHDKKWVDKNIEIYSDAIKNIKNNCFLKNKQKFIKKINNLNDITSPGFLSPSNGLLHLKRINNE